MQSDGFVHIAGWKIPSAKPIKKEATRLGQPHFFRFLRGLISVVFRFERSLNFHADVFSLIFRKSIQLNSKLGQV